MLPAPRLSALTGAEVTSNTKIAGDELFMIGALVKPRH